MVNYMVSFNPIEERMSSVEQQSMIMHTSIAVIIFLLSPYVGGLAFLASTPFILYMMFKPKVQYLPAMIIYMQCGGQAIYLGAMVCLLYCIVHFNDIVRAKLRWLFIAYLMFAPFFLWVAAKRWGVRTTSEYAFYHGSVFAMAQYCSLSTFFWAASAFKKLKNKTFSALYFVAAFAILCSSLRFIGITQYHIPGFLFWALTYFAALLAWHLFARQHNLLITLSLIIFFVLFILIFFVRGATVSFTQFGLVVISFILTLSALRFKKLYVVFFPAALMILSTLYVLRSESIAEKNQGQYFGATSYDQLSMTSVAGIIERIERKAFDDRAVLWSASMRAIKEKFSRGIFYVDPYIKPITLEYYNHRWDVVRVETLLPSHNVFLQLTLAYGIFGIGFYLLFLIIPSLKNSFMGAQELSQTQYSPMMIASISFITFASFSGGGILNFGLAFLILGLLGAGYRHSVEEGRFKRCAVK